MAKTKLMSRNSYSWRKAQFYAAHQAPRAAIAAPLAQIGNKNILNRRTRNRRFKIKKKLLQFKNVWFKQCGRVIREMVVRCRTIYPGNQRAEYQLGLKTLSIFNNILCLKSVLSKWKFIVKKLLID